MTSNTQTGSTAKTVFIDGAVWRKPPRWHRWPIHPAVNIVPRLFWQWCIEPQPCGCVMVFVGPVWVELCCWDCLRQSRDEATKWPPSTCGGTGWITMPARLRCDGCDDCEGTGRAGGECETCGGEGTVRVVDDRDIESACDCPRCSGTGSGEGA